MNLAELRPGLTVGRLRIHSGHERLAARLAADRLLGGAELSPAGLAPAAVLVVRRLADPWPGRLDLRASRPDPGWQGRTRLSLAACAARAARPWMGGVPADADAVYFADRSELLACLLGDAADGVLSVRWWWKVLGLTHAPAVTTALAAAPESLPAVFIRLAERRSVAPAAAWLPLSALATLTTAMCDAYGGSAVVPAVLAGPEMRERTAVPPTEPEAADPPWARWIPAEAARLAGLAVEQEALAGLAIMLGHEPTALRRPGIVGRIDRWRAARPARTESRSPRRARPEVRGSRPTPGRTPDGPVDPDPVARPVLPAVEPAPGAHATRPSAEVPAVPAPPSRDVSVITPASSDAPGSEAVPTIEGRRRAGPLIAADVATEFGGLFHLVHLAQRLGLYGDFSTPARPGIGLGVWDFVTLTGRPLLGRADRPADPVWRLLAELQGRPDDRPPGLGFRPPRVWRVRPEWLDAFPTDRPWRHRTESGHLVLRHPHGFVVVEGRADLAHELRRYGVTRAAPDRARPGGPYANARARWIAHLAAFLRCRISAALGVAPAGAVRLVLCRPATVAVTATRVDVLSELADLPIEVRLAAVDRDPGFVPAAGRSLYFHFR